MKVSSFKKNGYKPLRLLIIALCLYSCRLFKEIILKCLHAFQCGRMYVCVHKLVSGLFPRRNHAHWLASREAPSQHVHDWGQVRLLCFPPTHQGSNTRRGDWGAGMVWERCILLTPKPQSPNSTSSDRWECPEKACRANESIRFGVPVPITLLLVGLDLSDLEYGFQSQPA